MDFELRPVSKTTFFACYFLFTAVHIVHLIAGMIALSWFSAANKSIRLFGVPQRPTSGGDSAHRSNLLAFRQCRRCDRLRSVILRLMNDPIVAISNLTYAYGQRVALNDLSLSVNRGEIFGFLGPNGSGKNHAVFASSQRSSPRRQNTVKLFGNDASGDLNDIRKTHRCRVPIAKPGQATHS